LSRPTGWSWRQLGYHDQPVGLLNVQGYYDKLIDFLVHSREQVFVPTAQFDLLQVGNDPVELLSRLAKLASGATAPDDFGKI